MICCEVLGWQRYDIKFLEGKIKEFGLEIDEVINKAKEIDFICKTDINTYIYAALYLGAKKIKNKIIEKIKEFNNLEEFLNYEYRDWESKIKEYETNIYTNYLDSGYGSTIGEIDYIEIDNMNEEKLVKVLSEMLNFNIKDYHEFLKEEGEEDE